MSDFYQGILISLIPALIVSVITAVITARITLKQFYSERWWERKADTYSHIIEQLSYMAYCHGEWLDEVEGEKIKTEEYKIRLRNLYLPAKESVRKASFTGAFIISQKAADALEQLNRQLDYEDPNGDWFADYEMSYKALKTCINELRVQAQKDLLHKRII